MRLFVSVLMMTIGVGQLVGCFEAEEQDGNESASSTGGGEESPLEFRVTSSDDVVWLGVFDRPTSSNAPDGEVGSGYISYTLSGLSPAQSTKSLRPGIIGTQGAWSQLRSMLAHRILPTLRSSDLTCSASCASGEFCIRGECASQHSLSLLASESATLSGEFYESFDTGVAGISVTLVVDATLSEAEKESVAAATERFAREFERIVGLLGIDALIGDANADDTLLVVATSQTVGPLGSDTIGWFNPEDWDGAATSGNFADILWLRPSDSSAFAQQVGTLVHEYFHLIGFAARRTRGEAEPEALWLDEAMAHAFEDFSGWGSSNISTVEEGLMSFSETALASGDDTLAQRGIGYTFIRYLIDQSARSAGAQTAGDSQVDAAVTQFYSSILNSGQRGWLHSQFATIEDRELRGWLRALLGASEGYLTPQRGDTDQLVGFDPFGQFPAAEGFDVYFEGPQFEELGPSDGAYEGFVAESGWNVLQISGLEPGTYRPELVLSDGRRGVLAIIPSAELPQ